MKMIDYRGVRLSKLNEPCYAHLKLLLFWPIFGLAFTLVERALPGRSFTYMHCALDDKIPFCEWFLLPYLFWFVYIVGMLAYSLLFDADAFRRYMKFIMLTYSASLLCYLLFPNAQNLRPVSFERDNLLTQFMAKFYAFDTNTNVCPSIHVFGAIAVSFAAWNSKLFHTKPWRIGFSAMTVLICISTVFVKQHSVLDVIPAVILSFAAYPLCFGKKKVRSRQMVPESE